MKKTRLMDMNEVKEYIKSTPENSSIYIGCDSQKHRRANGTFYASYARVVVVHYASSHGCRVFGDIQRMEDYGSLRMRLMQEVQYAVELANEVLDSIGKRNFEIHLDINPDEHEGSSIVVKEAVGYVRGITGIDPKIKPEAIASSYCADMFVRGKAGLTQAQSTH